MKAYMCLCAARMCTDPRKCACKHRLAHVYRTGVDIMIHVLRVHKLTWARSRAGGARAYTRRHTQTRTRTHAQVLALARANKHASGQHMSSHART